MEKEHNQEQRDHCRAGGVIDTFGRSGCRKCHGRVAAFLSSGSGLAGTLRRLRGIVSAIAPEDPDLLRSSISARLQELCGPRDDGSNLLEAALVLPFLILLLVGSVDYGRGFYTSIEVSSAAEAGALYGTLNATDSAGMVAMAKMDAADVSNLSAVATYGCECADGSASSVNCTSTPACSMNVVQYVEVTTSAVYTPTLPYPLIPSSFNLQNKVHLRTFN